MTATATLRIYDGPHLDEIVKCLFDTSIEHAAQGELVCGVITRDLIAAGEPESAYPNRDSIEVSVCPQFQTVEEMLTGRCELRLDSYEVIVTYEQAGKDWQGMAGDGI